MSDHKILFQNSQIKLVGDENRFALTNKIPHVFVLPYIKGSDGYPEKVGVIDDQGEINVLTIDIIDDDIDIFATAKRGLTERTGFSVDSVDKWEFLGQVRTSYIITDTNPAFSVDITALIADTLNAPDTYKEFNLVSAKDALNSNSALLHSLFLRAFEGEILRSETKNII